MLLEGIVGVQKEAVLAAKRSIVTVEEIVDDFGPRSLNAVILPRWTVGADRRGAGRRVSRPTRRAITSATTPSTSTGTSIARDRDSFLAWMKENVLDKGPEDFARHVRKACGRRRSERR